MSKLRDKIFGIFDSYPEDDVPLNRFFDDMDRQGRFDLRKVQQLLAALVEELEKNTTK